MNDELKNVTKWCEDYSEKTKLKIFPQSAPVLAIVEDLMSVIAKHQGALLEMSRAMIDINKQVGELQTIISELVLGDKKPAKKEVKK